MDEVENVRAVFERNYAACVATHDPQIYATQFAEDAIQMPPGISDRIGRDAIQAAFAEQIKKIKVEPVLKAEEIEVLGDFAYILGTARAKVTPLDGSNSNNLVFRAIWLLRKVQGEWKIARQIWHEKNS